MKLLRLQDCRLAFHIQSILKLLVGETRKRQMLFFFMASEKGAEPLNEAEDELDRWEEKLVFGMKEQRIDLCCEYCSSLPFTERSCWDLCCFFNV